MSKLWVRGELFDHGVVKNSFESDLNTEGPSSPCPSDPSSADAFPWGFDGKGFEMLGNVVSGAHSQGLGKCSQDVERCRAILYEEWTQAFGEGSICEAECEGLLQLFSVLKRGQQETPVTFEGCFALFVFAQGWREARSQHQIGREDLTVWPVEQDEDESSDEPAESPQLRSPRTLALDSIAKENESRLEFIKTHVRDLCWLLSLCESHKPRETFMMNWQEQTLPFELVDCLSFLIETSPSAGKSLTDLFPPEQDVTCADVERILCDHLELNNDANPPLVRIPSHLSPSGGPSSPYLDMLDAFSTASVEAMDPTTSKVLLISGVHRKTSINGDVDLVKRSKIVPDASLKHREGAETRSEVLVGDKLFVFDCSGSQIYVLRPFNYVRVIGCKNCTIVLGPCAGVVTVEHCSNVKLIGIARHLSVSNSYDSTMHVQTLEGRPLLFGECRNIVFGPLNTFYPRLLLHLLAIGENPQSSLRTHLWKAPIDMSAKSAVPAWRLMEPADFSLFVTPFLDPLMNMPCVELPYPLPKEFASAVKSKVQLVEDLLQHISLVTPSTTKAEPSAPSSSPSSFSSSSTCSSSASSASSELSNGRHDLDRAVQSVFKDWLVSSGKVRQLVDLVKIHQS